MEHHNLIESSNHSRKEWYHVHEDRTCETVTNTHMKGRKGIVQGPRTAGVNTSSEMMVYAILCLIHTHRLCDYLALEGDSPECDSPKGASRIGYHSYLV